MNGAAAPVYGLVLAGGASSRMKRDKAVLAYGGETQLDRAFELVARHVARVFVSVRESQIHEPVRARKPLIVDSVSGEGPIVGIRSALAVHPAVAWLVVACDLPFLSDAALEELLARRDPARLATAYLSAHDGLPEPLCTVWEPAAAAALRDYQQSGGRCPRKFLRSCQALLLEPVDRHALDNVNTPEEYAEAQGMLGTETRGHRMEVKIQYFALLREQAGRSEETVLTAAKTPAQLLVELRARYGFTLPAEQLRVAVNSEFADWSRPLHAGDAVVFIPPVAGG
ncbi:MAG: NTP transferase domain-containing protein [Pseudomonadota bacterium]|nr:NTP transferase domain-containing protein [Pseudomonadota bacterium]